jgi:hypothetical protein
MSKQIPITISPLDAWRGGRKPTKDQDEAAQRRYEEVMAAARPPKVCKCHPAPVTNVTVTVSPETTGGGLLREFKKTVGWQDQVSQK